jgi:hypothetical protein
MLVFRPLPPGRFLVPVSVRGLVYPRAIVRLEGLGQLKNPVTSSRIKLTSFWLVTLCLNQLILCALFFWKVEENHEEDQSGETERLPNRSLEHYLYSNLFGGFHKRWEIP